MSNDQPIHLAVALDGAGWHPASWRAATARPGELFTAAYWTGLAQEAERGLLDFVTIEDSLGMQSSRPDGPDDRVDQVRGRLDAVIVASRVAPVTSRIGLVPTVVAAYTEPFHISKAIATLDYVSTGRAGVRVRAGGHSADSEHFGRRALPALRREDGDDPVAAGVSTDLFDEAADYVEVVRRLWDSWDDDAEIRDVATGRFVDREKLHYIDFEGRWFGVKGPSITPRPPQGQPLVSMLARGTAGYRLAARAADIVYVTPRDADDARAIVREVRAEQEVAGRGGEQLAVYADLVVFLDDDPRAAVGRKERLDELDGATLVSDAEVFVGSPAGLAGLLSAWSGAGIAGFRLRPGALPHDLTAVTRALVPIVQDRGLFRRSYAAATLRGLLGLGRPSSRYAAV